MKDYVFTKDAVALLRNRFDVPLSNEDAAAIDTLEDKMLETVRQFLPTGYKVHILRKATIAQPDGPALYLDDVHFGKPAQSISLTRTLPFEDLGNRFDSERILQRPGTPTLEEQVRALKNDHYAVVDVGIFSGKTMLEQLKVLSLQGISVDKLVVVLAGKEAIATIDGKRYLVDPINKQSTGIEVIVPDDRIYDWGEWIEVRDLIGLDGRTLTSAGRTFECYSTRLQKHASIPADNCSNVAAIAEYCFNQIGKIVKKYGLEWQDSIVKQAGKSYAVRTVVKDNKLMEAP